MDQADAVVIGAGVVGLACARALALAGREVIVLESESAIGTGTSSRNSEVIHAGIYYPPGSLKAKLCVAGRLALYPFLAERGDRAPALRQADRRDRPGADRAAGEDPGTRRGQRRRRLCACSRRARPRATEPQLACVAALESPSTGIIDSHGFMLALRGDAEDRGAAIAFRSPVLGGTRRGGRHRARGRRRRTDAAARARGGQQRRPLCARTSRAHRRISRRDRLPPSYYCKGNYFSLSGRSPVHAPDLSGTRIRRARRAPHARPGRPGALRSRRRVDRAHRLRRRSARAPTSSTTRSAATGPDLKDGALQPAYSGIRPKIQARGEPSRDFLIQGPRDHGVPGLVNLFGIESPGLTAALAIGEHVRELLRD